MKWMIIIGLLCAGCASRGPYAAYETDERGQPPPRPVHGTTIDGRGTWQDLGGGMISIRDTRTGQTTTIQQ